MSKSSLALHQYDLAMAKVIGEAKNGLDKTDEILGQIQVHRVVHGGITRQVSAPKIVDTEMKHHKAELLLHFDVYLKTDVDQFIEFIYEMWEAFASQAKKGLFETVGLTTEAVGNTHALAGRNIWDAQLEVLESLEWIFDENGNHNYKFYCPDAGKQLAENPPTPEQNRKLEELIRRKRQEYYAKKRTRRLS